MFLSIIIPVHNCEAFLEECLSSLTEQNISKKDYQIICINDGSTDNSENIILEYQKRFHNIVLLNQEQGGVSKARNAGLKVAKGDYIWFVDADDFIEKNILKDIYDAIKISNCDRLKVLSYCFFDSLSDEEIRKKESVGLVSNYPYKNTQITRTVIKKSYIDAHKISFYEELKYGEDTLFNYETRIYSPNDAEFNKVAYYYRRHNGCSTTINSEKKRMNYLNSCLNALDIVIDYYNRRISHEITKNMLTYWIYILLEQYYFIDLTENKFVWNENKIDIIPTDYGIKRLNRICTKISVNHSYYLLEKVHNKRADKECNKRRKKYRISIKKILKYLRQ